jgi:hypothetical protein
MIALDLGRRASLASKTLGSFLLSGQVVEKKLHRDSLIEFKMLGIHHNTHSTLAQESVDPVLVSEYLAYGNRTASHGWSRYLRDIRMSFLVQTSLYKPPIAGQLTVPG